MPMFPFIILAVPENIQILQDYNDIFSQHNIGSYIFRYVGWLIIKGLKYLLDSLLSVVNTVYRFIDFGSSSFVKGVMADYKVVIFALMGVALIVISIMMIMGSDKIKPRFVLRNIAAGILVLLLMPTMISALNTLTKDFYKTNTDQLEDTTNNILAGNTYDLKYIFQDEDYAERYKSKNYFLDGTVATEAIWNIDINEQLIGNKKDPGYNDVFNTTYDPTNPDVEQEIDPFSIIVQINFLSPWYYRYSIDFLPVIAIYLVNIVVILFTIFKVARLAYELVIHQFVVYFLTTTDLATGDRLKEAVKSLISTYIVLCYAIFAVVLFQNFLLWCTVTKRFGTFTTAVAIIGVGLAVIDGPNLISRIFGIDAGVNSAYHAFRGIFGVGRAVSRAGKQIGRAVTKSSSGNSGSSNNNSSAGSANNAASGNSDGIGNQRPSANQTNSSGTAQAPGYAQTQSGQQSFSMGSPGDNPPQVTPSDQAAADNQEDLSTPDLAASSAQSPDRSEQPDTTPDKAPVNGQSTANQPTESAAVAQNQGNTATPNQSAYPGQNTGGTGQPQVAPNKASVKGQATANQPAGSSVVSANHESITTPEQSASSSQSSGGAGSVGAAPDQASAGNNASAVQPVNQPVGPAVATQSQGNISTPNQSASPGQSFDNPATMPQMIKLNGEYIDLSKADQINPQDGNQASKPSRGSRRRGTTKRFRGRREKK